MSDEPNKYVPADRIRKYRSDERRPQPKQRPLSRPEPSAPKAGEPSKQPKAMNDFQRHHIVNYQARRSRVHASQARAPSGFAAPAFTPRALDQLKLHLADVRAMKQQREHWWEENDRRKIFSQKYEEEIRQGDAKIEELMRSISELDADHSVNQLRLENFRRPHPRPRSDRCQNDYETIRDEHDRVIGGRSRSFQPTKRYGPSSNDDEKDDHEIRGRATVVGDDDDDHQSFLLPPPSPPFHPLEPSHRPYSSWRGSAEAFEEEKESEVASGEQEIEGPRTITVESSAQPKPADANDTTILRKNPGLQPKFVHPNNCVAAKIQEMRDKARSIDTSGELNAEQVAEPVTEPATASVRVSRELNEAELEVCRRILPPGPPPRSGELTPEDVANLAIWFRKSGLSRTWIAGHYDFIPYRSYRYGPGPTVTRSCNQGHDPTCYFWNRETGEWIGPKYDAEEGEDEWSDGDGFGRAIYS